MDLQFGDIQETALVTLAIRASETARPNPRIRDEKAKEIIDTLGVDTCPTRLPCGARCMRTGRAAPCLMVMHSTVPGRRCCPATAPRASS